MMEPEEIPIARVIFRVNGNAQIGLGHVMRCLAVAEILRPDWACRFAIPEGDLLAIREASKAGYEVDLVPGAPGSTEDANWLREKASGPGSIVVLDGYAFGAEYQRLVKERGLPLVCIDDLHQEHFVANAVINHGGASPEQYSRSPDTKLFLGPAYAMLRCPFFEAMNAPPQASKGKAVLICFGGSDPYDLTRKALEAAIALEGLTEIHVVVGSGYQALSALQKDAEAPSSPAITIHHAVEAEVLVKLARKCEFAITSASTIAYEICCVRCGLIAFPYMENQRELGEFLRREGLAFVINGILQLPPGELQSHLAEAVRAHPFPAQIQSQIRLFQPETRQNLRMIFNSIYTTQGPEI